MLRKINKDNVNKIIELLKNISLGIHSMIYDYTNLFTDDELKLFDKIDKLIEKQISKLQNNEFDINEVSTTLEYETFLKSYAFKCWDFEAKNGGKYVSWFKTDTLKDMPKVISSTFSKEMSETFCEARYGIRYEVSIDGFLGACNKDAATLIDKTENRSLYTIGQIEDNKIVNSYNLATPIITPTQAFDKSTNNYRSKHNEIILDSRYIKPISVVYADDADLEIVNMISAKYEIPIERWESKKEL